MQEPPPPSHDYLRVLTMVVIVGALIACSLWVLKPFLGAIVWAAMIVVATWPLKQDLERHAGGRRWIAVTLMTTAILVLLVVPLVVAVAQFVEHYDDIRAAIGWLTSHDFPPAPLWVERLPLVGPTIAAKWTELAGADPLSVLRPLLPYAGNVATWLAARAGSLGAVLLDLLLIVVFSAILFATGATAANEALRLARRVAGDRGVRATELAGLAVRAVALGVVVTAAAQSVLAGVGLAIAGVPNALLLTAMMFVLCLAQIGAVPVLAPAAIWLFWRDATGWGTFLLVWCVVVSALDNLLRPILIRRGADLPLLLVMIGVIGGLLAFGVIGLFVGPVVLAVTFTLMQAWVAEGDPNAGPITVAPKPAANPPRNARRRKG